MLPSTPFSTIFENRFLIKLETIFTENAIFGSVGQLIILVLFSSFRGFTVLKSSENE